MQYVLQRRRDDLQTKTRPGTARAVVRFLTQNTARSLLDRSEQQWREAFPRPRDSAPQRHALLTYARRQIEDLAYGHGWDVEYPRDVWRLRSLGINDGPVATLKFDRITQPWLKDLAKRWIRARLAGGISSSHAYSATAAVTRFAEFLSTLEGEITLRDIDRSLVERYLAYLHTVVPGVRARITHIGALNTFLQTIRRNGWGDGRCRPPRWCSATTSPSHPSWRPGHCPRTSWRKSKTPPTWTASTDPNWRLITVILIRCGLRITSATTLAFDCVVTDADGAPYLRYRNRKMKREALVPIDERTPADDQPSPAADRGALARGPRAVPTHESQHRGHPPGRSPRLPRRPGSLAARLRRP